MLKIFFLSVCLAVAIAYDGKSRILGGTNVGELVGRKVINHAEFPFMAQIKLKQSGSKNLMDCGASIIKPDVLLTSAYCLDARSPEDLVIFAGNVRKVRPWSRTQKRFAQKFVIHEGYNNTNGRYADDIAIIFLTSPFKTSKFVSPIAIQTANEYVVDTKVTAIGWGENENGKIPQWLQKTDLYLMANDDCQTSFNSNETGMTDELVCAIDQSVTGICTRDSGGPLVYNDKLIGVSLFGFVYSTSTGDERCDTDYPSVFLRTSYYYDWIQKILKINPHKDT